MALNYISAVEAASLIKHGYNIGLSGFTPAGTAKAVTAELAKIAEAEHAAGRPFQVGIFTGASTGDSCDGVLSKAKAIRYRAPYTTNKDFRQAVNNGEVAYNDIHLSQMAQELRYGFMGKVDIAIIEACEVTPDGKIYLTAAGGIAPTVCRLADKIIVELNAAHSKAAMGLHDVYEPLDPPYRREIPIYKPSDRIGTTYIQVDPKKIIGVVETNWPDEARSFAAADPLTDKIGQNVADFLVSDMKRGIIPPTFLPLQSGVGNIANAVLSALGHEKTIPPFEMYTEVIQNSVIGVRNLQQPRSGAPTGHHIHQHGHRGGHLWQCELHTHRRHEDDERHWRQRRLHPQCLYLHLHLPVRGQGRTHQRHRPDGVAPRPHGTQRQRHRDRTRRGRPARQEPERTCTSHHRELCAPGL